MWSRGSRSMWCRNIKVTIKFLNGIDMFCFYDIIEVLKTTLKPITKLSNKIKSKRRKMIKYTFLTINEFYVCKKLLYEVTFYHSMFIDIFWFLTLLVNEDPFVPQTTYTTDCDFHFVVVFNPFLYIINILIIVIVVIDSHEIP